MRCVPSVVRALSDLRSDSPPQRDQSTTSRRLCRCSRADGAILGVVSATECATRTLVAWLTSLRPHFRTWHRHIHHVYETSDRGDRRDAEHHVKRQGKLTPLR